jgi:hypothetical protein
MSKEPKKKPPQLNGRKKGGAMFPRINLQDSVGYAKKLVSKTHTGPLPESTILAGVFGASSSVGKIKASALKQYGLMQGDSKAYEASPLAKDIAVAPAADLSGLYQQACLKPKVFQILFKTFNGDTIALGRLRQQAAQIGVHPDELDNCIGFFVKSVVFAQLGTEKGDSLELQPLANIQSNLGRIQENGKDFTEVEEQAEANTSNGGKNDVRTVDQPQASARSIIHVNVTIDSSLDTDKLEKQLSLLRKYGAI